MDSQPWHPLPTPRSKVAGLALQLILAVLFGVFVAPTRGTAAAVSVALTSVPALLLLWWISGKWFTLLLTIDALIVLLFTAIGALGLGQRYLATFMPVLPCLALWLVGRTATEMQQMGSVPVTLVDPRQAEVGEQVVEELRGAGFRTEPDLGYALAGTTPITVVAYAHSSQPVYAQVVLTAGRAPHPDAVISELHGGGALETAIQARSPSGALTRRQVFPGADLAALTERHLEALAWLAGRGVAALPAAPGTHAMLVEAQLDDIAAALRAHPLRHAARHVALWACRRHLDVGPLQSRRGARGQVEVAPAGA